MNGLASDSSHAGLAVRTLEEARIRVENGLHVACITYNLVIGVTDCILDELILLGWQFCHISLLLLVASSCRWRFRVCIVECRSTATFGRLDDSVGERAS